MCTYEDLCYDTATEQFSLVGDGARGDTTVSLSAFVDGRSLWRPARGAAPAEEVAWIDVPTYLAVRHAPKNWGHYVVETVMALLALALASEEPAGLHGRRLLFFLDDCSLVLRGDATEYCTRFSADPLRCAQEIPALCASFTAQLWPVLTDWAPLEPRSAVGRVGGSRHLCFRSLHAGLGPWRRPVHRVATAGIRSWAADPSFSPVIRSFRAHAVSRLLEPSAMAALGTQPRGLAAAVKSGRRSVANREELLGWLREAAEARALRYMELALEGAVPMTLREQVAALAAAALLVASAGSSHFAGLLLPAGAAVLVLPMCVAVTAGQLDCHSEQLLACCGLRWEEYPVDWADATFAIGHGFDFVARRPVLEEVLDRLHPLR